MVEVTKIVHELVKSDYQILHKYSSIHLVYPARPSLTLLKHSWVADHQILLFAAGSKGFSSMLDQIQVEF